MSSNKHKKTKNEEKELEVPWWRPHDYESKLGIKYWWHPEWIRNLHGKASKIRPIKNKRGTDVDLYIESKSGNLTYIQGSVQREFKKWHGDRQIDHILLGENPDELLKAERDQDE